MGEDHAQSQACGAALRTTMSTTAIDAAYTALPQAPDPAFSGHPVVPTSLDVDEEGADALDDEYGTVVETLALDSRIRWILFALGAAVLLPWNGMSSTAYSSLLLNNSVVVMITATPYFLSRLTPTLGATFSSYLSLVMNFSNLGFLARATMQSKQVRTLVFAISTS